MLNSRLANSFASDPFFSDINSEMRRMNEHFNHMMGGFGFSQNVQPQLEYASQSQQSNDRRRRRNAGGELQPVGSWMDPYGMMDNMMSNFQQSMHQTGDSGVHSFSSSSFYSYSSDGRSEPRIIEAHTANRRAPGGVQETRRAYRDSELGVAKMAIGHHLDDRAHIIERSENSRTGQREQRNEFHGLQETDAERFNEEWLQRTRNVMLDTQNRYGRSAMRNSETPNRHAIEHQLSSIRGKGK